jgi:hypothetical protein
VLALNLGGKRGGAASTGIIDAVGYLCGAVVSGEIAGHLAQPRVAADGTKVYDYGPLFDVLAGVAAATLVVGVVYWVLEERRFRREPT